MIAGDREVTLPFNTRFIILVSGQEEFGCALSSSACLKFKFKIPSDCCTVVPGSIPDLAPAWRSHCAERDMR
jgi:hypothetical protein